MRIFLLLLMISAVELSPAQIKPSTDEQLLLLREYMSGAFSSALQAEQDSAYFPISLHMKPIWKERTDGFWLYVEQAMISAENIKPYRQRVYRVHRKEESVFVSEVYELRDPLRFAGDYNSDEPLLNQTIDSLILRTGCAITLTLQPDGNFTGKTGQGTCNSNLRGASYATSEVSISRSMLLSWDRGFDSSGKQVWGAEKGGYRFAKIKPYQ